MSVMRHIFGKDLRRLRWAIAAWVVVIGARLLLDTLGADVALGGYGQQLAIHQLVGLVALVQGVLLVIVVSLIVHDEPLVGRDAFWTTRPIAPGALLSAKVVLAVILFVVIPLVATIGTAAAFDLRRFELARLVPVVLVNQLMFVAILMTVAVLTPSLTRYVIAIVATVSAVILVIGSQLLLMLLLATEIDEGGGGGEPGPMPLVMGAFAIISTAVVVVVYQYRRRRLKPAVTIAVAGAVLSFMVVMWWPPSYVDLGSAQPAAPPTETSAVGVVLDAGQQRVTDTFGINQRTARKKDVMVRTIVSGAPPEFRARAVVARSRLELPAGVVVQTGTGRTGYLISSGSSMAQEPSIEAALGGARLVTRAFRPPDSPDEWTRVLQIEEQMFAAHRNETGRLTANIDIHFERPLLRATLPLVEGAHTDLDRAHIEIARVIRRATGCTVLLRMSFVEQLFSRHFYPNFMFLLRNRTRGEAAWSEGNGMGDSFSGGLFWIPTPHVGGRGFVLEQPQLDFPPRSWASASAVDLDESWVSGAEFVILETIPAGRVTRTVTIENFRLVP